MHTALHDVLPCWLVPFFWHIVPTSVVFPIDDACYDECISMTISPSSICCLTDSRERSAMSTPDTAEGGQGPADIDEARKLAETLFEDVARA